MSQEEVMEILSSGKKMTADEIALEIEISPIAIRRALNQLFKFHEVIKSKVHIKQCRRTFVWSIKIDNNCKEVKKNGKKI